MAVLLWPERKRCRSCRRFLDFEVFERLYCSRACGGWQPVERGIDVLDEVPRQCKVILKVRGGRVVRARRKRPYPSLEIAELARDDDSAGIYRCEHCGAFHFGHEHRLIRSRSAVPVKIKPVRVKPVVVEVKPELEVPKRRVQPPQDLSPGLVVVAPWAVEVRGGVCSGS
jgi:hypothetical protein